MRVNPRTRTWGASLTWTLSTLESTDKRKSAKSKIWEEMKCNPGVFPQEPHWFTFPGLHPARWTGESQWSCEDSINTSSAWRWRRSGGETDWKRREGELWGEGKGGEGTRMGGRKWGERKGSRGDIEGNWEKDRTWWWRRRRGGTKRIERTGRNKSGDKVKRNARRNVGRDGDRDCRGDRSYQRHLELSHWLWLWLAGSSYLIIHLVILVCWDQAFLLLPLFFNPSIRDDWEN